jgi:hypothetical protein
MLALLRLLAVVPVMTLIVCNTSEEGPKPVTCDAFQRCGDSLSMNALLCSPRLEDVKCGSAYGSWLECYSATCPHDAQAATDAGDSCAAQVAAWQECTLTPSSDGRAEDAP